MEKEVGQIMAMARQPWQSVTDDRQPQTAARITTEEET
jgi:hypothetical protein